MSEPIKIVLTAETQAAAKSLQDFCNQANVGFKTLSSGAHEAKGVLMENRAAIMELEHSARSMADGLIAGINPLRMMAMEGPRLLQAGSVMTDEFKSKLLGFLPILGGVGVAIAAGATAWHFYGDAIVDPTKRVRELADALQAVPDQLKKIQTALRAGVISPEEAQRLTDLANGKTPLYNVKTIADGYGGHALETRPEGTAGFLGGTPVPLLTTNATRALTPEEQVVAGPFGPIQSYRPPGATNELENLQPANVAQRKTYVDYQLRQAGVTDANNESPAADVSAVRLRQEEMRWMQQSELGPDKQEERIRRQADEAKNTLQEEHGTAQTSKGWTADDEKKYQDQIKSIDADADRAITQLKQRAATEAAEKQAEAVNKITEEGYKQGADVIKVQEHLITENQDRESQLRGQSAKAEYAQRSSLLLTLLNEGNISQEDYDAQMEAAQHKLTEGVKQYAAELDRVAALQREIAHSATEAKIKAVTDDKTLATPEKNTQLVPLYQGQMNDNAAFIQQLETLKATTTNEAKRLELDKQIQEVLLEQTELANKIKDATDTSSFFAQFSHDFADFQSKVSNLAGDMAAFAMSPFEGMRSGLDQQIDKLLTKGETAKQFFIGVAGSIEKSMIQSFANMAADYIMQHVIMATATEAWHSMETAMQLQATASQVGIHATGEVAKTGATAAGAGARAEIGVMETIWHAIQTGMKVAMHVAGQLAMTVATMAQAMIRHAIAFLEMQPYIILAGIEAAAAVAGIPLVGPILAPIAAATTIAGLEGLAAFAEGGRPPLGQMSIVGEEGPELFIPDTAGTIIPADQTARMLGANPRPVAGAGSPAGSGAPGAGNSVSVYSFLDPQEMQHHLEQNDDHEKWVVSVMGRNAHKLK
jgi:hypothetical protein